MEDWDYPGAVKGWSASTMDHNGPASLDRRTAAFSDTRFPHTGRHALRIVNPAPATTAWPLAFAGGGRMMANTSYAVSAWVRALGSAAGQALSVVALAAIAEGDTVILTENDSTGSKITVKNPKE
jgi:hypothetical protein